jgi:hypothetical protein
MSLTPTERAESLLSEAVMILYAGFRSDDFPEHYISSLAPGKMEGHLHELRTLDDPTYRFHRAKTVRPRADPVPPPDGSSSLQPLDGEGYLRLIALADKRVAEAVNALWEGGAAFAKDYMERSARRHMMACLQGLRAQESPAERSALVSEVNRLRASVGFGPVRWEEIVTPSR